MFDGPCLATISAAIDRQSQVNESVHKATIDGGIGDGKRPMWIRNVLNEWRVEGSAFDRLGRR
jgi:hypothetical protein